MALRLVNQVYTKISRAAGVPLIGIGGIRTAEDALEFIIAGAAAVQVGTAVFTDPACMLHVIEGIEAYLARHKMPNLRQLTGSLQ